MAKELARGSRENRDYIRFVANLCARGGAVQFDARDAPFSLFLFATRQTGRETPESRRRLRRRFNSRPSLRKAAFAADTLIPRSPFYKLLHVRDIQDSQITRWR